MLRHHVATVFSHLMPTGHCWEVADALADVMHARSWACRTGPTIPLVASQESDDALLCACTPQCMFRLTRMSYYLASLFACY